MEVCIELGKSAQNNEIVEQVRNFHVKLNFVFEHLMQQFFESQHLATTPPSPTCDVVELHPPILEQLMKEATDAHLEEDVVDMLSEEDTLAQ